MERARGRVLRSTTRGTTRQHQVQHHQLGGLEPGLQLSNRSSSNRSCKISSVSTTMSQARLPHRAMLLLQMTLTTFRVPRRVEEPQQASLLRNLLPRPPSHQHQRQQNKSVAAMSLTFLAGAVVQHQHQHQHHQHGQQFRPLPLCSRPGRTHPLPPLPAALLPPRPSPPTALEAARSILTISGRPQQASQPPRLQAGRIKAR